MAVCVIDVLEAGGGNEKSYIRTAADAAEYCGLLASLDVVPGPTRWLRPLCRELCEEISVGLLDTRALRILQGSEFHLFDREWDEGSFVQRFGAALEEVGVSFARSRVFRAAFGEMIGNAQEHPQTLLPAIATFDVTHNWWMFSVTDLGVGIPERLRQNHNYRMLGDIDAVIRAIQPGVSTHISGGYGFTDVTRVLIERAARIRIRSGRALLEIELDNEHVESRIARPKPNRVGCHIRVGAKIAR